LLQDVGRKHFGVRVLHLLVSLGDVEVRSIVEFGREFDGESFSMNLETLLCTFLKVPGSSVHVLHCIYFIFGYCFFVLLFVFNQI
jgi:hypothetical protein